MEELAGTAGELAGIAEEHIGTAEEQTDSVEEDEEDAGVVETLDRTVLEQAGGDAEEEVEDSCSPPDWCWQFSSQLAP